MQIIDGGYYVTREGNTIRIKQDDPFAEGDHYPFAGSNGTDYTEAGRYWHETHRSNRTHDHDLIREATPDEVIAFEAGRDVPVEAGRVENCRIVGGRGEGVTRTYADLFDNTTATSRTEPWEGSEAQARVIEGMEIDRAIGRSVAFRNRASGIMQIALGIAALLFAASGFQ